MVVYEPPRQELVSIPYNWGVIQTAVGDNGKAVGCRLNPLQLGRNSDVGIKRIAHHWSSLNPLQLGRNSDGAGVKGAKTYLGLNPLQLGRNSDTKEVNKEEVAEKVSIPYNWGVIQTTAILRIRNQAGGLNPLQLGRNSDSCC